MEVRRFLVTATIFPSPKTGRFTKIERLKAPSNDVRASGLFVITSLIVWATRGTSSSREIFAHYILIRSGKNSSTSGGSRVCWKRATTDITVSTGWLAIGKSRQNLYKYMLNNVYRSVNHRYSFEKAFLSHGRDEKVRKVFVHMCRNKVKKRHARFRAAVLAKPAGAHAL